MPILNIVMRGDNVKKKTFIRTERPINLTYMKINHVYHNLDSFNLADPVDKKQQHLLFLKFTNLFDTADKTITYVADWDEDISVNVGGETRNYVNYDSIHGFLVGTSKHNNSAEVKEKELFQVLFEDTEPIEWNGELDMELYYLDKEGKLKQWSHGNVYDGSTNLSNTSFFAIQLEYHEA